MRNDNAIDLTKYLNSIDDDLDRVLFQDAVDAAKAGVLRAAYIMTWLACAESLKRRFKELATRDGNALKVVGEVEKKEKNQQSIDKYLIGEAHKYGIIADSDRERLEHVYHMRCIFGHPYELQPKKEELVAAASTVVQSLLSKPVKLREGFLAEQVRRLTENQTYLDDTSEACAAFVKDTMVRVADDLHLWFLRKLWRAVEPFAEDAASGLFFRRGLRVSVHYLVNCETDLIHDWNVVDELVLYPRVLSPILSDPNIFVKLDTQAKDMVFGNLLEWGEHSMSYMKRLEELYDSGHLSNRRKERFDARLSELSIATLANAGINVKKYVGQILKELETHNWYSQNPAVDVIQNLGPDAISQLPVPTQFELGQNITQAAHGSAGHAVAFLKHLSQCKEIWPNSLVEGIISECVLNDDDEVRFKINNSEHAFRTIVCLDERMREAVVKRITDKISTGNILEGSRRTHTDHKERLVDSLSGVISADSDVYAVLTTLRDSISNIQTTDPD